MPDRSDPSGSCQLNFSSAIARSTFTESDEITIDQTSCQAALLMLMIDSR